MADAVGTTVGGILGTSTVTTYIESATGVEEGGRTGMTALVVGLLFLGVARARPARSGRSDVRLSISSWSSWACLCCVTSPRSRGTTSPTRFRPG
ncbi:MAG: hypothetical protein U5K28_08810 [Halobacteriales archaeon]|nr:hypothetical protein [Halobacteriales archaeon]